MRLLMTSLFVFASLSACLSSPEPTCNGEECGGATPSTTPMITRDPGVPFPPIPANESLRSLHFEGCTGLSASIDPPAPGVLQYVPSAFRPISEYPGTAKITIQALQCDRVALPTKVLEHVSFVHISPNTNAANSSWEPTPGASYYLFDFLTDATTLAQELDDLGIPARTATFSVESTPTALETLTAWKIQTSDLSVNFSYFVDGKAGNNNSATPYYWTGKDSFLRASLHSTYVFDTRFQDGLIQIDGSDVAAKAAQLQTQRWAGSPLRSYDLALTVDGQVFHGG